MWQNPSSNYIYKWCYANNIESSEHGMWNQMSLCEQYKSQTGGENLVMDEQVDLNPTSSSLMLSKITQQFNGPPIPTFIYTNDTVKAICAKAFLRSN